MQGEEEELQPSMTPLARNYRSFLWDMWKNGKFEDEGINGKPWPHVISASEAVSTTFGKQYRARYHYVNLGKIGTKQVRCRYYCRIEKREKHIQGFENLARALVRHIYGALDSAKIESELFKPYTAFPIFPHTNLLHVSSDPRGVSKVVVAAYDIPEGQVLGIYEGQWFMQCEYDLKRFNLLERYEAEWKLFDTERSYVHAVDSTLAESSGVSSFLADGKLYSALWLDGSKATGYFQWVTELNDIRDDPFNLDRRGKKDKVPNVEIVEVRVVGWPFFFAISTQSISKGGELLIDYGPAYWQALAQTESDIRMVKELLNPVAEAVPLLLESVNKLLSSISPPDGETNSFRMHHNTVVALAKVVCPLAVASQTAKQTGMPQHNQNVALHLAQILSHKPDSNNPSSLESFMQAISQIARAVGIKSMPQATCGTRQQLESSDTIIQGFAHQYSLFDWDHSRNWKSVARKSTGSSSNSNRRHFIQASLSRLIRDKKLIFNVREQASAYRSICHDLVDQGFKELLQTMALCDESSVTTISNCLLLLELWVANICSLSNVITRDEVVEFVAEFKPQGLDAEQFKRMRDWGAVVAGKKCSKSSSNHPARDPLTSNWLTRWLENSPRPDLLNFVIETEAYETDVLQTNEEDYPEHKQRK